MTKEQQPSDGQGQPRERRPGGGGQGWSGRGGGQGNGKPYRASGRSSGGFNNHGGAGRGSGSSGSGGRAGGGGYRGGTAGGGRQRRYSDSEGQDRPKRYNDSEGQDRPKRYNDSGGAGRPRRTGDSDGGRPKRFSESGGAGRPRRTGDGDGGRPGRYTDSDQGGRGRPPSSGRNWNSSGRNERPAGGGRYAGQGDERRSSGDRPQSRSGDYDRRSGSGRPASGGGSRSYEGERRRTGGERREDGGRGYAARSDRERPRAGGPERRGERDSSEGARSYGGGRSREDRPYEQRGDRRPDQRGGRPGSAGRPPRDPRGDRPRGNDGGRERRPIEREPLHPGLEPRPDEPATPTEVNLDLLSRGVKAELRGLSAERAEKVAAHLAAAAELVDVDPALAYAHAEAARRRAARLPVVREAAATTAYAAGEYAAALNEFRALRRMTGSDDFLAVMADCERGLGRPQAALKLVREGLAALPPIATRVELKLVEAGARDALGQADEAIRLLRQEIEQVGPRGPKAARARLRYYFAELLAGSGDEAGAEQWFGAALRLDPDNETGAAEALSALQGVTIEFDETEDEAADAEEARAGQGDVAGDAAPPEPDADAAGDEEVTQ